MTSFLMLWCISSSMRPKRTAGDIITNFWYPGISVCIRSSKRLLQHSFSIYSLKDPWHDLGVLWVSSCPGGGGGCSEGTRCVVLVQGLNEFFLSTNQNENQNI